MPNSMTGFARQSHSAPWGDISCEIRSVNHRYLEPMIRLPEQFRACETAIRDRLRQRLQRGKVEVSIQYTPNNASTENLVIDIDALNALNHAVEQIKNIYGNTDSVDPLKLLKWPGVLKQSELDIDAMEAGALNLADKTLSALIEHRQREGQELKHLIEERLVGIDELVIQVRADMPEILRLQREKLQLRLEEFKIELDESRVEQEMVILANKADVAEELDRLQTHLSEVKHILTQSGPIGRRLDFMMQELNREANTLSSKSLSSETSQAAVSIKVLIEQMREQIQNIE